MRHQSGHLFSARGWWYLRFDLPNADGVRRQKAVKIARVKEVGKREAERLKDAKLRELGKLEPSAFDTIAGYVEESYMPWAKATLRPSTLASYEAMWKRLKPYLTTTRLHEMTTPQAHRLLEMLAQDGQSKRSVQNLKFLLSGIYVHAIRGGAAMHNPVREAGIPRSARAAGETHAYSLAEVERMVRVLPEPWRGVVVTAAFTGLRMSELRGLRWSDYDGETLRVRRRVWRKDVGETKTVASKAAVPVIGPLRRELDRLRAYATSVEAYVFESPVRKDWPLALHGAHTHLRAWLRPHGLAWYGWHAFRRGLATNLYELGVPDITIQAILRHSDVSVTRDAYIKRSGVDRTSVEAMRKLEGVLGEGRVQ